MNERFPMQRRMTGFTLTNALRFAAGSLLLCACAATGDPPGTQAGLPQTMGSLVGTTGGGGAVRQVAPPAAGTNGVAAGGSGSGSTSGGVAGMVASGGLAGAGSAAPSVMTAGAGGGAAHVTGGSGADAGNGAAGSCLAGVTTYDADGPFKFTKEMMGMVHIWVPMVPAGCKVPIVHYANGTNSTCNPNFPILERLATHGFLTACYEDPNTGAGTQAITAFDAVMMTHGDMADTRIGSMGHSQGGQAAFIALQLAEAKYGDKFTYAGLAVEPASGFGTQPMGGTWQQLYGKIKSPMFMFSGTMDNLVSEAWVRQAYDAMPKANEVYWFSAVGATHVPAPVKWQLAVATPWFRWKLLGEKAACEAFKKLPDGADFDKRDSMNEAPCQ